MLRIRLSRAGKRNNPVYKIVVAEHHRPVKGKFIEQVGLYNPLTKEKTFKEDRIAYWLSVGAKPSQTVHNILVSNNIIDQEKIAITRAKTQAEK